MKYWFCAILMVVSGELAAQGPDLRVQALLPNTAVVKIDGQQHTLRAGDTEAGVKLISADSRQAIFEIDGARHTLGVSQHIGSNFSAPEKREVTIRRDDRLQYLTKASLNGISLQVLVDTGANIVAMSTDHADSIGLDYEAGIETEVETASGLHDAWVIKLRSVDVGGIKVENVEATVIDGDYPTTVLLGMSYLRHVEMRESGGILSLSRDW
ncbi:MAG: TIGR02281 family clan AA aspartic protease [Halioglobus sp.]